MHYDTGEVEVWKLRNCGVNVFGMCQGVQLEVFVPLDYPV